MDIERESLALWTILSMRWPRLADYLIDNPTMVEEIRKKETSNIPEDLHEILKEEDVLNVLNGGPTRIQVDVRLLEQVALLRG
jgi:hypothetical protein